MNNLNTYVSTTFGDFETIKKVIGTKKLNYILTYPGFVTVVALWQINVNFDIFGLSVEGKYKVYNSDRQLLYTARAVDNKFGTDPRDRAAILNTNHGDYLEILAYTPDGVRHGLLWVCHLKPESIRSKYISDWRKYIEVQQTRKHILELYINQFALPSDRLIGGIDVYSLSGQWQEGIDHLDIINNVNTTLTTYDNSITIALYPANSIWYVFTQHDSKEPLHLTSIQGAEKHRVINRDGVVFIDAGNRAIRSASIQNLEYANNTSLVVNTTSGASSLLVRANLSVLVTSQFAPLWTFYPRTNVTVVVTSLDNNAVYDSIVEDTLLTDVLLDTQIITIDPEDVVDNMYDIQPAETLVTVSYLLKARVYRDTSLTVELPSTFTSLDISLFGAPPGASQVRHTPIEQTLDVSVNIGSTILVLDENNIIHRSFSLFPESPTVSAQVLVYTTLIYRPPIDSVNGEIDDTIVDIVYDILDS